MKRIKDWLKKKLGVNVQVYTNVDLIRIRQELDNGVFFSGEKKKEMEILEHKRMSKDLENTIDYSTYLREQGRSKNVNEQSNPKPKLREFKFPHISEFIVSGLVRDEIQMIFNKWVVENDMVNNPNHFNFYYTHRDLLIELSNKGWVPSDFELGRHEGKWGKYGKNYWIDIFKLNGFVESFEDIYKLDLDNLYYIQVNFTNVIDDYFFIDLYRDGHWIMRGKHNDYYMSEDRIFHSIVSDFKYLQEQTI
jgi:hypothetical protein